MCEHKIDADDSTQRSVEFQLTVGGSQLLNPSYDELNKRLIYFTEGTSNSGTRHVATGKNVNCTSGTRCRIKREERGKKDSSRNFARRKRFTSAAQTLLKIFTLPLFSHPPSLSSSRPLLLLLRPFEFSEAMKIPSPPLN